MLRLRSVFTIKNNTRHAIKVLANDDCESMDATRGDSNAFHLESKGTFHVPLSLLHRAVKASNTLGMLFISPADESPVLEEISTLSNIIPGSVDYSTDPINLYQTIAFTESNSLRDFPSGESFRARSKVLQLRCNINPKKIDFEHFLSHPTENFDMKLFQNENSYSINSKLPSFCYNIEVIKETKCSQDFSDERSANDPRNLSLSKLPFFATQPKGQKKNGTSPTSYLIGKSNNEFELFRFHLT